MISTQYTSGLSLMEFGAVIGLSPWLLAQVIEGFPSQTIIGGCEEPLFQFPYQASDTLSRDEVVECIDRAERMIANVIGFFPVQRFIVNERQQYPRYIDRQGWGGVFTKRGQFKPLELNHRNITGLGIEALEVVEEGATLVFSDTDGDGVQDRFTLTVTVDSGFDPCEAAVYFTATDRNNDPMEFYEFKPIRSSVTDTTLTIIGHKAQCVKPDLYMGVNVEPLNVEDDIYVSEVDVYRRYIDTDSQCTLIWENVPCDTGTCTVSVEAACLQLRDGEQGLVAPQVIAINDWIGWFGGVYGSGREPDRLTVNYVTGVPRDQNGYVNQKYRGLVAKLAAALLPNKTKGCKRADQRLRFYQDLPTDANDVLTTDATVMRIASEWFGTQVRGALEVASALRVDAQWGTWS